MRSVATPRVIGFWSEADTKVSAYTNSCKVRVKVKITVVRMPGNDSGRAILMKAPNRLQPSTIAASSISTGSVLKNPMSSHVQKGMVKVGYTTTSDHIEFCNPRRVITRDSGRKRSVGGTR